MFVCVDHHTPDLNLLCILIMTYWLSECTFLLNFFLFLIFILLCSSNLFSSSLTKIMFQNHYNCDPNHYCISPNLPILPYHPSCLFISWWDSFIFRRPSVRLSVTKVLILPTISFFFTFCIKLAFNKPMKVTKPDFRKKNP